MIGLLVITSDIPEPRSIWSDCPAVFFEKPGNVEGFALKVINMLSHTSSSSHYHYLSSSVRECAKWFSLDSVKNAPELYVGRIPHLIYRPLTPRESLLVKNLIVSNLLGYASKDLFYYPQ
jgi:hypothetical protein